MDISDFNRKLANFIADARSLEKTDQKRANAMWLKICEFAIEFSKQKNIDRALRLKIWSQVDQILKKVKGEETSSEESVPETLTEQSPVPFEVDFGFDLPSVPKEGDSELSQEEENVPFHTPTTSKDIGTSSEDAEDKLLYQDAISSKSEERESQVQVNNFLERIKKMEDELRKMPEIFKEIQPPDYTPDKSIIPPSSPPPQVSREHFIESPTSIEKNTSISIEPVERPDTIDPYKGTKDTIEIKDPFGPDAQDLPEEKEDESDSKGEGLFCYACGASIRAKDKKCPKCGAEL
ncbi:MAG: zinc ribbon domain-containing protein [Candidatus Lokiarchaeota archaeon]|nr:zinc ribbon domain-containing protein [Candidatus Lokiarchaeota archaeon]